MENSEQDRRSEQSEPQQQESQPPQHVEHAWAPPPRNERSRSKYLIPSALIIGCLPWLILFTMAAGGILSVMFGRANAPAAGNHLALIRVEGEISTGRSGGGFMAGGVAGSETVIAELEKARKSKSVKGILIRVDSPGGSPAASEEIYKEIARVRKQGKPVYVSMGDLAASGGYYISAAADQIYADSSTMTGSIGVIWRSADLSKLYKTIGYSPTIVKAGKYKDMTSAARTLSVEERQIVQQLVDQTYSEFVSAVAEGRNKDIAQVRKLAEGRIYSGLQAKKIGLVDQIGGLDEARQALGKRCGLGPNAKTREYGKSGLMDMLFSGADQIAVRIGSEAMRGAIQSAVKGEQGELN